MSAVVIYAAPNGVLHAEGRIDEAVDWMACRLAAGTGWTIGTCTTGEVWCDACFPDGPPVRTPDALAAYVVASDRVPRGGHERAEEPADADRSELDQLLGVLATLHDGEVLAWGDDAYQPIPDELVGWVDVWAPRLCEPLRWNWAWVVLGRPDPPTDSGTDPLTIIVAPDALAAQTWKPQTVSAALSDWVRARTGLEIAFAFDGELRSPVVRDLT